MTPSGIEPATFRFVAQHLNHCAIAVDYIRSCKQSSAPDDGRKHRPKHVELIVYKQINQKVAFVGRKLRIILTMHGYTNIKMKGLTDIPQQRTVSLGHIQVSRVFYVSKLCMLVDHQFGRMFRKE